MPSHSPPKKAGIIFSKLCFQRGLLVCQQDRAFLGGCNHYNQGKMRKISWLNMARRGTKLPCYSRAPQDPHSSWDHKSHHIVLVQWQCPAGKEETQSPQEEDNPQGAGAGLDSPTALPFPATLPAAPALAAVPAPSTAHLAQPRWHWAFLALGPFRLPPPTGIWGASSFRSAL